MINTRDLIKTAAYSLYRIKCADLGYENGWIGEGVRHLGKHIPPPFPQIGKFVGNHFIPIALTTAAIGGGLYGYNRYKQWKKEEEEKKRKLPKVIPSEVLADDDKGDIPVEVLADDSATAPASVKASSYRKVNKVLNWIYS